MTKEYKETTASTSLDINCNCPYCNAFLDIRDVAIENLTNGELSAEGIEQEVTCEECNETFIVTDIYY